MKCSCCDSDVSAYLEESLKAKRAGGALLVQLDCQEGEASLSTADNSSRALCGSISAH